QLAQVLDDPFEYAAELRLVQTQAQDLAAEMGLNEDDAEEAQAVRKVTGQALVDAFGDRVMMSYRNNDVVLYQKGYFRLEFVYDHHGTFQDLHGYPADEPRPDDLEQEGTKLQDFYHMNLIERDWDQLTPMQQAVLDRDTDYDEHYRSVFDLDEGDRVRFVLRGDQNRVVECTYQDRRFVADNGQRFGQQDIDQSAGFIAVG